MTSIKFRTVRFGYGVIALLAFVTVCGVGGCMDSQEQGQVMGESHGRPVNGLPLDPIDRIPADPARGRPPVLTCPEDLTVECDGAGNQIELDAWYASVDVDSVCDNLVVADDFVGLSDDCGGTGSATVTWTATDDCGTDTCSATFAIVDTTPPEVTVGEMVVIWSPNHEYWTFDLSDCVVSVEDACEGELDVNEVGSILSIYSDEPEDVGGGGDGHTIDDIVILGNSSFSVRAERQGAGNGRVYGVQFEVRDAAGNAIEATCFVGVPHDWSGEFPVDDGSDAGYTVSP